MNTRRTGLLMAASALIVLAGCQERPTQGPIEPPADALQPEADETVHLTAYINVASGCQDWTVTLLKELDEQYDAIDVEIIDFGMPEGAGKMAQDDVHCMALLFDGSPVVRIRGEDGQPRLVTFYFPVGFGWTHDDLRQTFAAIASGEAEILSEDEARVALAPTPVEMEVGLRETDEGVDVLMNGQIAIAITEPGGGQTPLERAQAARDAIEEWTSEPVHPRQLRVTDTEQGWTVAANGNELVHVYPPDAAAAGVQPGKKYAAQWLDGIRCGIVAAARNGQEEGGEQEPATAPE